MSTKLYDFIRTIYHAFPLLLGSQNIVPGTVLDTRWLPAIPIDTRPQFRRVEGMAWELLNEKATSYRSQLHSANILVGKLTDKLDLSANINLPQFGLSASGALKYDRVATLTIDEIHARMFRRGFAGHELRTNLRTLRQSDSARWKWVDDDFLVTECYYVSGLTFSFLEHGDSSAKLEFEQAGVTIGGGFKAKWSSEHDLRLVGTAQVPFAVRGLKI